MRVEGIVLEDHADAPVLRGQIRDIFVAEEDLAAGGPLQAADQAQACGFTAAGRPQKTDQLAVGNFKIEIVDGDDVFALADAVGKPFRQIL